MEKKKRTKIQFKAEYIAGLAFLTTFAFFQFAYPYHLIRREQQNLFLYDWDYIRQTYTGTGWLVRFVTDFFEQFFHLPVFGPVIVAFALAAIGWVTYSICRKFLDKWPSFAIAVVLFGWSFMRETGNIYYTRYTFVVLGYLALILAAMQFKKHILKAAAFVVLMIFGTWALGSPYHENYGKAWSTPKFDYERLIGLDAETAKENWDRVLKLSKKDLFMKEASYFYNLAHVMKGDIGDRLLEHSQGQAYDLVLRVTSEQSVFTNSIAGEAWYQMGNMSTAEQSSITTLQASPKHTGVRYLKRLAEIGLVKGEEIEAGKYLNILNRTLFYRKWARSMMPGHRDEATQAELLEKRAKLDSVDFVHLGDVPRDVFKGLLAANPGNTVARNYLLCYDLMRYDLDMFMEEYSTAPVNARLYHEAALIWLSQYDKLTQESAMALGISESDVNRMNSFGRNPDAYRNTYWYYYLRALNRMDNAQNN